MGMNMIGRGLVVGGVVALAAPAEAALPPEWQRVRELTAVIEAAAQALEGRPIDAVEWTGSKSYSVRAGECTVEMRLEFIPTEITGPAKFEVLPGEVTC